MKNRRGISLIEIILSIAILGLVAISMLSIFDSGLFNIRRARITTENTMTVSSELDNKISNRDIIIGSEITVNVKLTDSVTRNITGELISSDNTDINGRELIIKTFLPGIEVTP